MSSHQDAGQGQEHESMALVLEHLVSSGPVHETGDQLQAGTSDHSALTPASVSVQKHPKWWSRFFPGSLESTMERLFASHHMGNYVAIRGHPDQKIFESMPIYVRVGMHLLFYKSKEQSFLRYKSVEDLLKTVSVRQGKVYDDESNPHAVLEHIQSFIKTYSINLDELLQPDPSQYPNFNSFFYRKLKPGARPIAEPANASIVSSCADCRLTVFSDVAESTKYWIKGDGFTLNRLIGDTNLADRCFPPGSSIAIFRLAPADYHRFHHPVGPAVCGPTKHIAGEYFTVNPQAVNAEFDVFSGNRRDVLVLNWSPKGESGPSFPVAFVAIGAMLVGSIGWTNANQGSSVQRGDECGYYAYGGSTNIVVFPPESKVEWDQDLLDNSRNGIETMQRLRHHQPPTTPITFRRRIPTLTRTDHCKADRQLSKWIFLAFDTISASRFGIASHNLARHAVTINSRAPELFNGPSRLPRQEISCVAGPSRLPVTSARSAHSSSYSGNGCQDSGKHGLASDADKQSAPTRTKYTQRSYSSTQKRSKTPPGDTRTSNISRPGDAAQPQWWDRTSTGSSQVLNRSMDTLNRQLASTDWPFRPSRSEDLYRDAYLAHPDRFDWRKSCGSISPSPGRPAAATRPPQRRRASASMVRGEESKMAAKTRRTAERKMDDRSLRMSREKAASLLSRYGEREPIRQQAKVYRNKWAELLDHERMQELSAIAERRKAPIDKLIEEGIAIDGLQGYWQDDSKRHFGKRVAVFKLDAAEPLPRTLFRAGDKVTIMPSASPSSACDDPASPLEDEVVIEAEVVERQRNSIRLKFDESDEDFDLVSCPSWRLDYGFNDLTFERIKAALEAMDHDVEHIENQYGSRFQYILSGTRLSDVILGIEPPSDRVQRGAFWEDARVQSWYDRFARQDPIVVHGDPLPNLNRSQTQAVAMMLRERVSLIQGPPGTGKTRTIVTAIKLLKQDFKVPHPIMLAAHTNVAVDNLADGCIKAGLRVVRIGPSARARAGIDQHTLDAYFLRHPGKQRLDQIKRQLDTLDRLKSEYEMGRMCVSGTSTAYALQEEADQDEAATGQAEAPSWEDMMADREEEREAAQPQGGTASEEYEAIKKQLNRLKATYFFLRASIRGEILNGADVICGSAIAAGSPELDMIDLPVVFFDEASMATEPVSLVPLMKGCRHLSIIGDHKQLPPVVTSTEAKQGGLSRSLFERLIHSGNGIPSTMLNVQFRMHPSLADFPNKTFYDGALQNGEGTELIPPVDSSYWPSVAGCSNEGAHRLCFIDHKKRETKAANSTSLCNTSEARIVLDVAIDLLQRNPDLTGDDIGIVTPYAGQQVLLEKMLHNEASPARQQAASILETRSSELGSIDIHTVDGFEGREKKVILFSTVRTNAQGYVGFLADGRRLNVALTRAQSALFVIGNIETFNKAQLSEAAYSRVESPNLEALQNYAAYMEKRGAVVSRDGSAADNELKEADDEEMVDSDAAEAREIDDDAADWQHVLAERDAA